MYVYIERKIEVDHIHACLLNNPSFPFIFQFTVNVMLNIAGTQDEHFPRAAEYLPERWLRHHPLGPINHYASIPFSTGLRNCVGRRLSEQESYTIVARVSPA